MKQVLELMVAGLGVYFGLGLLFALYFISKGAKKIDPAMNESKIAVKLLILPGSILLWPMLLYKLMKN